MEYFLKEEMLNVLKILFNIGEELKRFTSKFGENRCQKILDSASKLFKMTMEAEQKVRWRFSQNVANN